MDEAPSRSDGLGALAALISATGEARTVRDVLEALVRGLGAMGACGAAVRRETAPGVLEVLDEVAREAPEGGDCAVLPLAVGAKVIGTLRLSFDGRQPLGDADHTLLRAVADQCAQALERLRLDQALAALEAERSHLTRRAETDRSALVEEKQRLEAVMEALPVGVAITDLEGGTIKSNAAFEEVWRGPRPPTHSVKDYLAYKAWWVDTRAPVAPEEWASALAVERGEPIVGQLVEIEQFDGGHRFVMNSAAPVRDPTGAIVGSAVAIQDVTELRRVQEALQKSEERYRTIADWTYDWEYWLSPEGNYLYVSPSCECMTGYRPQDFIEDRDLLLRLVHPDDRERVGRHVREIDGSEASGRVSMDFRIISREGRTLWIEHVCQAVTSPDGRHLGRRGSHRDVTERRRAEEELRQTIDEREAARDQLERSHQRLNEIIASIEDDFYVLDRNWLFVHASRQFTRRVGMEPKDFVGRNIWEMFPRHVGSVLEENFRAAMDLRETRRFEVGGQYTSGVYRMTAFPSADGLTVLGTDVTEQRRAEEELRTRNAVLEGIARILREALISATEADLGRVCLEVAEAVTGSRFGFIGELDGDASRIDCIAISNPGWEACAIADPATPISLGFRITGLYGEVLRTGKSLLTNAPTRHAASTGTPPGHPGLEAFLGVPLIQAGRTIGMFGLGNRPGGYDAVQREAAETLAPAIVQAFQSKRAEVGMRAANQRLADVDRRKNEFLAVLSHELRNPLAPIRNSLHILDQVPPGGERAQRALAIITRQVAHLSELVDDLLDITRITRNKIQLQKERLELNEALRRAVEDNRATFERFEVRLELVEAPSPIYLDADRTRLAQIVGNLLQNAAKFSRSGGWTRISAGLEAGEATVRVADDGVGMSAEILGRLFQPFMQAEQSLDRSKGGLGLGLALVKGLAELHGGSVSATSAGLGLGAELVLRLPAESAPAQVDGQAPALARPEKRRILIVEDNIDAAESLREVLELEEHEVAVAYDGPQAIDRARSFRPEFVLCDIGLPGMDGFEVARAFRRDSVLKDTILVALTGYALPGDVERAQAAGFEQHLAKPPNMEKLANILAAPHGAPRA